MNWEDVRYKFRVHYAWMIVKHRPLLTCPFCKGSCGHADYYGEWSECHECWDYWHDLEDHGFKWFAGRMPIWAWIQSKISLWVGFGERERIWSIVRCKTGFHYWMNEDSMEPGLRICACCFESKHEEKKAGE